MLRLPRRIHRSLPVSSKFTIVLALILVATVGAIGVAFQALSRVGDSYQAVAERELPRLENASRLGNLAAGISGVASQMVASGSNHVRLTIANRLKDRITELDMALSAFVGPGATVDSTDAELAQLVRDNRDDLRANLEELSTVVQRRIVIDNRIRDTIGQVQADVRLMETAASVLMDGQQGDIAGPWPAQWPIVLGWAAENLVSVNAAVNDRHLDRMRGRFLANLNVGLDALEQWRMRISLEGSLGELAAQAERLVDSLKTAEPIFALAAERLRLQRRENGLLARHRLVSARLTAAVAGMFDSIRSRLALRNQETARVTRESELALLAALLAGSALVLVLLAYVRVDILRRLEQLRRAMLGYVDGERPEIPVEGRDEIADIGKALRYLVGVISEREEGLRNAKANAEHLAAEAEAANRAKSAFLANMSHELRTPLNAVIGFAEMIEHFHGDPAKSLEYAGYIGTSGRHLLDIISDVLNYSKIEAGKQKVVREKTNLAALVRDLRPIIQYQLQSAQLKLDHDIDESVNIMVDAQAMRQVLVNLLSNAIKFSLPGGRIQISAGLEGDSFEIRVADEGLGIAPEHLESVMLPFHQAHSEGDTASMLGSGSGGTGLGLAIVNTLVQLHDGRVQIESSLGAGTTVHLIFPLNILRPVAARATAFGKQSVRAKTPGGETRDWSDIDDIADNPEFIVD